MFLKNVSLFMVFVFLSYCSTNSKIETENTQSTSSNNNQSTNSNQNKVGCPEVAYPPYQSSPFVLPYPVGRTYKVGLSHCSGSYHSQGQPDQFAVDFNMSIGTLITASREGIVVYVEETGEDFHFPNNLVVVKHSDNTFAEYMHLTKDGAIVNVGDQVIQGSYIGYSGATGLAGYPHLHFVVVKDNWEYPYESIPYTFKNTTPNPRCLESGGNYKAEPY